jgi:hypothetical protein
MMFLLVGSAEIALVQLCLPSIRILKVALILLSRHCELDPLTVSFY